MEDPREDMQRTPKSPVNHNSLDLKPIDEGEENNLMRGSQPEK